MRNEEETVAEVVRGVRLDLAVAVCALLISTLAAAASWWQARVLVAQTRVLQEQLGAQVWPYLSVEYGVDGETVHVFVANDGMGPAILHSFTASVDGFPESSFTAILHALLGPHLLERRAHGERFGFSIDGASPGAVIRAGEQGPGFSLTSPRFSKPLLKGYGRASFRLCYCAIIPGKCWFSTPAASEPAPITACPEIGNDLLHASPRDEILNRAL